MVFRPEILVSVAFAAFMLAGCVPGEPAPSDTQIFARVKSPDGSLEAIYAGDVGGGAAVGTTEEVFVVPFGAFPKLKERIFAEECVHDLTLRWQGLRALAVSYTTSVDYREHKKPYEPSLFSLFSGGYWTFGEPHGVQARFASHPTPADTGC